MRKNRVVLRTQLVPGRAMSIEDLRRQFFDGDTTPRKPSTLKPMH